MLTTRFGVLIPVGPNRRDVVRLHALVEELRRHEDPAQLLLVVIDDAPRPRELSLEPDWPECEVVRTAAWAGATPDVLTAHVAATLEGFQAACGVDFVLKLDTDAAVIRPFSEAIGEALLEPGIGAVGSYDVMSTGAIRDWSLWKGTIDRADRRLAVTRAGIRLRARWRRRSARDTVRSVRTAAYRTAPPGAHCLGGAYAVSRSFLSSVTLDWRPWARTNLGEDVVVGLLCSAVGLRMRSLTGVGEPFAVAWRGLPGSPEELAARGASIVHSVKLDDEDEEAALRARLQRATASGPAGAQ